MPRRVETERDILRQREQQEVVESHNPSAFDCQPEASSPVIEAEPNVPSSVTLVSAQVAEAASRAAVVEEASATIVMTHQDPQLHQQPSPVTTRRKKKVHIAIQGCCHGELDKIYEQIREHETNTGQTVDFLLCCGDFQSIRNKEDMQSMAVPDKYKTYGDFVKYYRGEKRVPVLTLFIGGNHEASNLLAEEYYGGYVSEGIFYLGHSSVVTVCGVRIGSLSGIYKGRDYTRPYPTVPYDHQSMRDAYHVRGFELEKLHRYAAVFHKQQQQQVEQQQQDVEGENTKTPEAPAQTKTKQPHAVDIMLSHDWPVGITKYGNEPALLRIKPYFADDISHGALGNPYTMELLKNMRPKFWFAAHLHCHFTAQVAHLSYRPGSRIPTVTCAPTEFVALDKCIHQSRKCLTFMTMEVDELDGDEHATTETKKVKEEDRERCCYPSVIMDPIWVDIVKQTHGMLRTTAETSNSRGGHGTAAAWERSLDALPEFIVGGEQQPVVLSDTATLLSSMQLEPNPLINGGFRRSSISDRPPVVSAVPAPAVQAAVTEDDDGCSWVEDAVGRVGWRR
ncbi:Hypothetical protein, putative [Bodo saltans]|uniref:Calcineurin-like phosphoesterase domain-containing protein n=1 Tax=Bodo saltans TaxID=75058 RepID=A0A0S4ITU3_BODSA|nr:Hypothetical protein, putative [Bodo saltans]|eukprot:CUG07271.1 Hypothetical protein, putative [Bodo saltans]